jgi:tight adherence protein C
MTSLSQTCGEIWFAGYFSPEAPLLYTILRGALVVLLPAIFYVGYLIDASEYEPLFKFAILAGVFLLSYYIPQAYIARKKTAMEEQYRIAFPDFLDLLVVCVDAGLSLEAALEKVSSEIQESVPAFATNLALMSRETRAGRSTSDALGSLADRLGLEEARSFAMLIQQSLELGTDVAQALRTFSDEMREKRLSRAETRAHALPVKLVLPLGAFIFPVLLIVVMTPLVIRIVGALAGG